MELRQPTNLQTLDEFVANVTSGVFEGFDGAILFFSVAERTFTKMRACFMSG